MYNVTELIAIAAGWQYAASTINSRAFPMRADRTKPHGGHLTHRSPSWGGRRLDPYPRLQSDSTRLGSHGLRPADQTSFYAGRLWTLP